MAEWSLLAFLLEGSNCSHCFRSGPISSPCRMATKDTRRGVEEEDLANVEFETSEDVEVIPTFDSMSLREDLLRWVIDRVAVEGRLLA